MHGSAAFADELCTALAALSLPPQVTVVVLPPTAYLGRVASALQPTQLQCGAQNAYSEVEGAFTGEVAAEMIADLGGSWLLVGHSERRAYFGESDDLLAAKYLAALRAQLTPMFCVGETLSEREAGRAESVVTAQLRALAERTGPAALAEGVLAYEPVWAIGTGLVPSNEDIAAIHAHIRNELISLLGEEGAAMRIVYGGSLKPGNADEILAIENVDGGLIGGASLKSADFLAICNAVKS